jgi:hypothetical protein
LRYSLNGVSSRRLACASLVALALFAVALDCYAVELEKQTVAAFNHYVEVAEQQMQPSLRVDGPFLWIDFRPQSARNRLYKRLQSGEFVIRRLNTYDDGQDIEIPDGMVHHWIGLAFVPGATLKSAEAVLEDYQDYARIYAPEIRRSIILSRNGDNSTKTRRAACRTMPNFR